MDVNDQKELHLLREENARLRLQLEKHELESVKARSLNFQIVIRQRHVFVAEYTTNQV